MKKKILYVILLVLLLSCKSSRVVSIDIFQPYDINGNMQWILINGNDKSNPVLLYLAGGPGTSMIPYAHVNTITDKMLAEYTVAHWDQRGTGLSYDPDIPKDTITINQYIEDTHEVIKKIKTICGQDKVYLLGHSWGAILGVLYCQKYPEDIKAYIGVGQFVAYYEGEERSREWLKQEIHEAGNDVDLMHLEEITWADRDLIRKYGGTIKNHNSVNLYEITSTSPYHPEKYSSALSDKGVKLVRGTMREELWELDFRTNALNFEVPVYFFIGRNDYVTAWPLTKEYFDLINAPCKEIIWFDESAHRCDIEEPEKFQNELIKIQKKPH
ncbi:MAG: alpha/beta hydrolase [Spirochaetales bacterium]|nr:alpha/beta hydrolase [Spirochaetales bacterium]